MYKVGIDLGGTNIAAGVIDENNKIIAKASVKTNLPRPAESIADSIAELTRDVVASAGLSMDDISFVGVGTPGAVTTGGVVEFSANLGFVDTPLKQLIKDRVQKSVWIENDANCAALGERIVGCGKGVENFIAVTLGTGVGGGIIVHGKLMTGVNGAAGEIGHMIIIHDGLACPCGRKGCFEQYASASALVRQTRDALLRDREHKSIMWQLISSDLENVDGRTVFDAARQGDEIATKVIDAFVEYLAAGVANLINVFQPEKLCIGGGVSKQGSLIIDPLVDKIIRKRYTKHAKVQTEICAATLGNDAGLIGAALLENNHS